MTTTRPHTHDQRDDIDLQVETLVAVPTTPTALISLDALLFKPFRDARKAARQAQLDAAGRVKASSNALDQAGAAFQVAARYWMRTVVDDEAHVRTHEIAVALDLDRPSSAFALGPREMLTRFRRLIAHVAVVPALQGDPGRYAELTTAADALEAAATADVAAFHGRKARTLDLETADGAYDVAYVKFYGAAAALLGSAVAAALLPRFVTPASGAT
jgi:hypothetical protein